MSYNTGNLYKMYKDVFFLKIFSTILSLVLCLVVLAGCNNSTDIPSATEISNSIKSLSSDTVDWASLDNSSIPTYFGIPRDNITDFCGYINSSEEKFDMIAVFKFNDTKTREDVIGGISSLIQQMSDSYSLANANEVKKITMPIVAELDNTVILCIMDANSKVDDYILNELKAKTLS